MRGQLLWLIVVVVLAGGSARWGRAPESGLADEGSLRYQRRFREIHGPGLRSLSHRCFQLLLACRQRRPADYGPRVERLRHDLAEWRVGLGEEAVPPRWARLDGQVRAAGRQWELVLDCLDQKGYAAGQWLGEAAARQSAESLQGLQDAFKDSATGSFPTPSPDSRP